jgi:hypothetical protein
MIPEVDSDYKSLFSQLIKKQMLVLGPDITLAKVRNVTGLIVDINGDVQKVEGDPQVMLQSLINQFVELSGMIVKKTMESILSSYPGIKANNTFTSGTTQAVTKPEVQGIEVSAQTASAPVGQAVTASPSIDVGKPIAVTVTKPEPPAMTGVKLESLSANPKVEEKAPDTFTAQDMNSLNKALDDLSKAPLSTEAPTKTA